MAWNKNVSSIFAHKLKGDQTPKKTNNHDGTLVSGKKIFFDEQGQEVSIVASKLLPLLIPSYVVIQHKYLARVYCIANSCEMSTGIVGRYLTWLYVSIDVLMVLIKTDICLSRSICIDLSVKYQTFVALEFALSTKSTED
jgi:hypothetical protein